MNEEAEEMAAMNEGGGSGGGRLIDCGYVDNKVLTPMSERE
jgi:hypothetical protein